jgi:hypothetical protein
VRPYALGTALRLRSGQGMPCPYGRCRRHSLVPHILSQRPSCCGRWPVFASCDLHEGASHP